MTLITDPRFSSAHTDPRFRPVPRRESKVSLDSRFEKVFTEKASTRVDKRGKLKRKGSGKDSLKEFYRIEEDDDTKKKKKNEVIIEDDESSEESEGDQHLIDLKSEAKKRKKSEESSEEEILSDKKLGLKITSVVEESDESAESDDDEEEDVSEEEEEEVDTDDEEEAIFEDDGPEVAEEDITSIEKETHRLAIVRMDWRHVSAKDLYVVLNSFLPKDGRILSVAVYPTDFGLERMKEEEIHGPAIDGFKKNEDDHSMEDEEEEEEEDEDVINEKFRDYEKSKLKYYHAVAECDSSATADYLYKSCDGLEFEKSSNKLDLRFIPDSMEFKHPARDIATEAPANYEGLDFQSRALQMSKVNLSWDEDEPHRMKTLNQKFKPDQLAEHELKGFLASDESESDDDNIEGIKQSKEEKRKEKYRALLEAEDVDSDKEEEDENDQDMEVTFNTGLEDLSKQILVKKDNTSESVWESYLRQKREKKRARKNKQKEDSSSDDDDYNVDRKAVKGEGDDDFFMEEPPLKKKKKKEENTKKKKKEGLEEEERSRAELELLLADENAGDGNGLKGYNIKRKNKRGSKEIAEEKIPVAELDDPRFSAAFSDPQYALDPTDPQFKRSATYARQVAQKQKEDPRSHEEVKDREETKVNKESTATDGNLGSKKKNFAESLAVKSLKLKIQQKVSEKKEAGNAVSSSDLGQRMKKKAKALSIK